MRGQIVGPWERIGAWALRERGVWIWIGAWEGRGALRELGTWSWIGAWALKGMIVRRGICRVVGSWALRGKWMRVVWIGPWIQPGPLHLGPWMPLRRCENMRQGESRPMCVAKG